VEPKPDATHGQKSPTSCGPSRWGEGRDAFARIKCYNGIPKEFEGQKMIKIAKTDDTKWFNI
jgi:hypothetical protein